jgi:hypothetical protein
MTPDTGPNRRLENALHDASAARPIPRADPEVSRGRLCRTAPQPMVPRRVKLVAEVKALGLNLRSRLGQVLTWPNSRRESGAIVDELVIMWLVKTGTLPTTFLR